MRAGDQHNLQGIREDLDYQAIRSTVANITNVLADMHTLTPDLHLRRLQLRRPARGLAPILACVERR